MHRLKANSKQVLFAQNHKTKACTNPRLKIECFANGTNSKTKDFNLQFTQQYAKDYKTDQIDIAETPTTTLEIDPNNYNTELAESVGKGQVSSLFT